MRNHSPLGEQVHPAENYLRKAQVAERLGLSTRTICAYMAAGIIPYIKLQSGRRGPVRFRWRDIESALRRFEVGG